VIIVEIVVSYLLNGGDRNSKINQSDEYKVPASEWWHNETTAPFLSSPVLDRMERMSPGRGLRLALWLAFSAMLVEWWEGHLVCKKWVPLFLDSSPMEQVEEENQLIMVHLEKGR